MTIELTLFTATLVQDSALSVSGLERSDTASRRPFTIVDGVPVLAGPGIKGALVSMAGRFFDPLPRTVSDQPGGSALRRSMWECTNTKPIDSERIFPATRAGVGIRQKTGGRADGVLHDREVIPAGTEWELTVGVNWRHADSDDDARYGEGILGYILDRHWREGRCWLGGDVARGLGWCHLDNLRAYQFTRDERRQWLDSERQILPSPLREIPTATPTRSWHFRTLDVDIAFGEYRPDDDGSWGLDMLAVGAHDLDRDTQKLGDGTWAAPPWGIEEDDATTIPTRRAVVMSKERPVLPGSSVRGPLRHALSRALRAEEYTVTDPNGRDGEGNRTVVGVEDPVAAIFGTVETGSGVLVRDATAENDWYAARLQMHSEDEFTGGSYGSAKRDAVRVLRGVFPLRIVVEARDEEALKTRIDAIDGLVALGRVGHLPVGGHKTRGAGWGRWSTAGWQIHDVRGVKPSVDDSTVGGQRTLSPGGSCPIEQSKGHASTQLEESVWKKYRSTSDTVGLYIRNGLCDKIDSLTLAVATDEARRVVNGDEPIAWWCEPSIDFTVTDAPNVFGTGWPATAGSAFPGLRVDEVCIFFERALWRAARTVDGIRWVLMREVEAALGEASVEVEVVRTPAQLHGGAGRFASAGLGRTSYLVREWTSEGNSLGFTIGIAR